MPVILSPSSYSPLHLFPFLLLLLQFIIFIALLYSALSLYSTQTHTTYTSTCTSTSTSTFTYTHTYTQTQALEFILLHPHHSFFLRCKPFHYLLTSMSLLRIYSFIFASKYKARKLHSISIANRPLPLICLLIQTNISQFGTIFMSTTPLLLQLLWLVQL